MRKISQKINVNKLIESQLDDILLNIACIEENLKNINETQFYDNVDKSAEQVIEKLTFISRTLNNLVLEFPDLIEDEFIKNYGIMIKKDKKTVSLDKILVHNKFFLFYKKIWNKITQLGHLKEKLLNMKIFIKNYP